ncbi:MAG: methyltransferase domain-containing protein [Candidatus Nanohaloarchaea archaeon]
MDIELLDEGDWTREEVEESIREILSKNRLLSMATVKGEDPHINTCFYTFDDELNLYILTPPDTEHGENLENNDSVAVDVHDSHQEWTDDKQGLQIFGKAEKVEEVEKVLDLYLDRYSELGEFASNKEELEELDSIFYKIEPDQIKVFDEPRFGTETWINVEIRSSPIWGEGDEETLKAIENEEINGKWLNLAAGDGRYTPELLEKVDELVATDIDEKALNKLSNSLSQSQRENLEKNVFDLTESFPFQKDSFDGVFCTGTLHLFGKETLKEVFEEIDRVLKTEGKLIFDFATDIERIYPNTQEKEVQEKDYSEKEARDFLKQQLKEYDIKWKRSEFEDDLTGNPEYGWKTKGNFILVVAEKKGD